MRFENTRVNHSVALQHRAATFESRRDLMDQVRPLVAAALERGSTVALSVSAATRDALVEEFGERDQLVWLTDPPAATHSGQTMAAQRALQLRSLTVMAGPVVMVSEHRSELDGVDGSFWTEQDAAFNIALADLPIELTCFYPELPLHRSISDGAAINHPLLMSHGTVRPNPAHRNARAVLALHPAPVPELLGAPDLRLEFGAWQLNEVRTVVEKALVEAGYARSRAEDLVLAVNEVASNAVEHGASQADLSLWLGASGAVCEVHDRGTLTDPLPGLQAPHSSQPRGRGIWIARQIVDSLHVWADATGTHVRMHAERPV